MNRSLLPALLVGALALGACGDDDGAAVIEPTPGVYTVQVRLDSSEDALCFWGETTFGVAFPSSHIDLEAAFICAGG